MRFSTLTLWTIVLGLGASLDAAASWKFNQCRKADMLDVRGDTFDGALGPTDGKTTIAEAAAALANDPENPEFTTLLFAVSNAPTVLAAASDPAARITVFAPTDAAFGAVPGDVLNGIIAGEATDGSLTDILLYHVVGFKYDPRRTWYVRSVPTLQGGDLFITRGRENPSANNSNIACEGVKTDNGYIWAIDSVLMNQYFQD